MDIMKNRRVDVAIEIQQFHVSFTVNIYNSLSSADRHKHASHMTQSETQNLLLLIIFAEYSNRGMQSRQKWMTSNEFTKFRYT